MDVSGPVQGFPPYRAATLIDLFLKYSPGPQVTEQGRSVQLDHWQSLFTTFSQPSVSAAELHVLISVRPPSQNFPFPAPNFVMLRSRLCTQSHFAEQASHLLHSLISQSALEHGLFSLHARNILSWPVAGTPQSF